MIDVKEMIDRRTLQKYGCLVDCAEEHNNGWIPCSERLPEEANDYLVTQYNKNAIDKYCNGYRIEKIFFDEDDWWDDTDFRDGWEIIAWMPLPAPYKGEQK